MTIPFLDFFNKLRTRFLAPTVEGIAPRRRATRVKKPEDQHFHKTVLPNTTRSLAPPDPFSVASGAASSAGASMQFGPASVLSPTGPTISRARDLPRALALALEPKVERVISLPLSDFIDQVPPEYIKPVEVIDASRMVGLKASEIEKGMPEQNPTVSLTSLYQQVPEIFLRSVLPSNATRVPLPYAKVLEQFNSARVREDQERDQRVPQLDTPILQATIKDTERFGTKIEPLESSDLPPVPVETASAEAFASAEPEPVAYGKPKPKPKEPGEASPYPVISLRSSEPEPEIEPMLSHETETTPSDLPPNGTGAPASERVPASSGPPVPNPSPPRPEPPKRIPFKPPVEDFEVKRPQTSLPASEPPPIAPPPPPARSVWEENSAGWISKETYTKPQGEAGTTEKPPPPPAGPVPSESSVGWISKETYVAPDNEAETVAKEKETKSDGDKVTLPLKPVLQNVPAFQLNGDVSMVPEDARIEFPLRLVKSQLAGGRVSVTATLFRETLPETYRGLFVVDPAETPVALPLQELLKNLPDDALKIRADQEQEAPTDDIETPFSKRAEEDAERFQTSPPVPKVAEESAPKVSDKEQRPELPVMKQLQLPEAESFELPTAKTVEPPVAKTVEPPMAEKRATEAKKGGDVAPAGKIDGKEVVAQACRIAGVSACEITFPDGLSLAGNFPPETEAEGLCAMAPMVLQRVDQHMAESKLGSLTAMTLHSAKSSVTFFMKENICLAALHEDEGALAPEARAELEQLVDKLSHTYAQPETPHVDH
jgi:predicted regulator of Ras-like GTPase activity (Roadblock/LC7/MglB family)